MPSTSETSLGMPRFWPGYRLHVVWAKTTCRSASASNASDFVRLGGLIGDVLIGPGVGTLGAAIIGGLAGNKHAKDKNEGRSGDGRKSLSRVSRDSY